MFVGWYCQWNYGKLWIMERAIAVFATGLCLMSIGFDQSAGLYEKLKT